MNEDGYDTPYAQFLERMMDDVCTILEQLILAHGEHKPIDSYIAEIEKWMGDCWWIDMSEQDQKRLDAIKGWTYK